MWNGSRTDLMNCAPRRDAAIYSSSCKPALACETKSQISPMPNGPDPNPGIGESAAETRRGVEGPFRVRITRRDAQPFYDLGEFNRELPVRRVLAGLPDRFHLLFIAF